MGTEVHSGSDTDFVSVLLKEIQRYSDQEQEQFNLLTPGQGAKSEVLFNSIGVFTSKGFDGTTVQDLLDAASISRRTFYKYFKNKVEVLESVYQTAASLLVLRFRSVQAESATTMDFIVRCIELYFDFHRLLGPLILMMTEEARRAESPLAAHRDNLLQHIVSLFAEQYHQQEGKRLNPKVFYGLIWMIESTSMAILSNLPCDASEVEEYKRSMCAICARVMVTDPVQWSAIPELPTQD